MKIRVMFKTPDALHNAITENGLSDAEATELKRTFERYVQYGECITVEFDTERNTCAVVPQRG